MAKLTTKAREHIKESNFALPDRRYPIEDEAHARNALARASQHASSEEKAKIRSAVYHKYPGLRERKEEREEKGMKNTELHSGPPHKIPNKPVKLRRTLTSDIAGSIRKHEGRVVPSDIGKIMKAREKDYPLSDYGYGCTIARDQERAEKFLDRISGKSAMGKNRDFNAFVEQVESRNPGLRGTGERANQSQTSRREANPNWEGSKHSGKVAGARANRTQGSRGVTSKKPHMSVGGNTMIAPAGRHSVERN